MRILVTDGMDKSAIAQLTEMGHEVVEQFYEPDQLGQALRDFDAVVVRSKTKVRANHIDEAKGSQLKLIIRGGVGVDNIDVKYAEANGIKVMNTPKASSQSVAELALGHMFSCARYISVAGHTMREDKWEKKAYGKGIELSGKTLGIVGFGRIGQKLGIMAKTEHNEVAPGQHELAPIFTTTNIAADHNQLTMELMQKTAKKHGMVCLLHEKPFAGVNGSGKHNNWSITTNTGVNLLEPGETPYENAQFLLFLCAVIQAVDDYQDMLRIAVASAGNDHRLGANEAPPAIVSIFLGDELQNILTAIEDDAPYGGMEKELIKVGVHVLPKFPRDTTDRNRTSPFAFTGNKFEFRMLGSANSISGTNVVLNTAVAESLRQYADILEAADDFEAALHDLIKKVIKEHKRIIFNGNGYDDAWIAEAEGRGLLNLKTTPDCVPHYLAPKNVALFTRHKVYSESEIHARYEIKLDNYCKVLHIEALTMLDMVWKDILPAVSAYSKSLTDTALAKKSLSDSIDCSFETDLSAKISGLIAAAVSKAKTLEYAVMDVKNISDSLELAKYYESSVLAAMNELRIVVDELEIHTSAKFWPYPSYGDLLFSVK